MPKLNTVQIVGTNLEIIQLSFGMEQANTYLVVENGHAIVIDACSAYVVETIKGRNLILDYVVLTHEHVDHIWGLNALRDAFPTVAVIAQKECSEAIQSAKTNKAAQYRIYAILRFGETYQNKEADNKRYFCKPADVEFDDVYELQWHGHKISVFHTPGHSPGSCITFLDDIIVFSGDTVLKEETFLKFDGGDEDLFAAVTVPIINYIGEEVQILPGHGKPFIKRDWKKI